MNLQNNRIIVEISKLSFCHTKAHFIANRIFEAHDGMGGQCLGGQIEAIGHSFRSWHYPQGGLKVDNRYRKF